jgi:hypothetical protein
MFGIKHLQLTHNYFFKSFFLRKLLRIPKTMICLMGLHRIHHQFFRQTKLIRSQQLKSDISQELTNISKRSIRIT